VRVQRQSPYQSPAWRKGITTGEYPAKLRLIFTDEAGEWFEWTHGFSHTRREWDELENYIIVPKGEWTHFEVDVLSPEHWVDAHGKPLPHPTTLEAIYVGCNGREFDAAITDLRLDGCDGPTLAMPTPPPTPTPIPSPMPDIPIPPDRVLFLEMEASADGKLVEGEPVRVHVAPSAYTMKDGVLRSDEPIFASSRLLLGESVVLSGAAGGGAYRRIYESSFLPVERSIGGTYVPLELTARIEAVEPDGTVHVVLNGESVVLRPGQRWMRSELQIVETERSTIEYASRITFQNHGLLARDDVIGPMPTPTPAATEEQ
jgi:hypothetical protein